MGVVGYIVRLACSCVGLLARVTVPYAAPVLFDVVSDVVGHDVEHWLSDSLSILIGKPHQPLTCNKGVTRLHT